MWWSFWWFRTISRIISRVCLSNWSTVKYLIFARFFSTFQELSIGTLFVKIGQLGTELEPSKVSMSRYYWPVAMHFLCPKYTASIIHVNWCTQSCLILHWNDYYPSTKIEEKCPFLKNDKLFLFLIGIKVAGTCSRACFVHGVKDHFQAWNLHQEPCLSATIKMSSNVIKIFQFDMATVNDMSWCGQSDSMDSERYFYR